MNTDTVWNQVTAGAIYVIMGRSGQFYVEPPEQRGLEHGPGLIRVFLDMREAWRYCDAVMEYQGEQFAVQPLTIQEFWPRRLPDAAVAVCSMSEDEWPRSLETLWAGGDLLH